MVCFHLLWPGSADPAVPTAAGLSIAGSDIEVHYATFAERRGDWKQDILCGTSRLTGSARGIAAGATKEFSGSDIACLESYTGCEGRSYSLGVTTMEDTGRKHVMYCNSLFRTAIYTHIWDTHEAGRLRAHVRFHEGSDRKSSCLR